LLSFGLPTKEDAARPARESCAGRIYAHKHQAIPAEITEGIEENLNRRQQRKQRRNSMGFEEDLLFQSFYERVQPFEPI